MDRTITEQELFDAIIAVTEEHIKAADTLYISTDDRWFKSRTKFVNDVLVELGYDANSFYKYMVNREA